MTHLLLQLSILILRMYKIEDDVERASEDERQEQREPGQIRVALRTTMHFS